MAYSYNWHLGFRYLWAKDGDQDNCPYYAVVISTRNLFSGVTGKSYFVCKPSHGFATTKRLVRATWYPLAEAKECADNYNRYYGSETNVASIKKVNWWNLLVWWLTFQIHFQSYDFKDFTLNKSTDTNNE